MTDKDKKMSDRRCYRCRITERGDYEDPRREMKYINCNCGEDVGCEKSLSGHSTVVRISADGIRR